MARLLARCVLVCLLLLVGLPGGGLAPPKRVAALPLTLTVTSTADVGGVCPDATNCTLREAVNQANANPGSVINFGIPGPGPYTITLGSALNITNSTVINGGTQSGYSTSTLFPVGNEIPGNNAVIPITIRAATAGYDGLVFAAGGTVSSLRVLGFDTGIRNNGGTFNLQESFIGIAADGSAVPNGVGVRLTDNAGSRIGPLGPIGPNVISGNASAGILIEGASFFTTVAWNLIGTNALGTSAVPNGHTPAPTLAAAGIWVRGDPNLTQIGEVSPAPPSRNLISGNLGAGVRIEGPGSVIGPAQTQVRRNYIGLNAAGTGAVPNTIGILELNAQILTQIGSIGGAGDDLNVISGNGTGIVVDKVFGLGIGGNRVGLNLAGTGAVPNGTGIVLRNATKFHGLGGATGPLSRLVISGNTGPAVSIEGPTTTDNTVLNTFIGTDPGGTTAIPNGSGIVVSGAASTVIDSSRVHYNVGAGIVISGTTAISNTIRNTTVFANGGLGIDLGNDGVTPNGVNPNPARPNRGQNYPTLTSAVSASGVLTVTGTLTSTPSTSLDVQFYSNAAADPSGYGEGQTLLATQSYNTDATGKADVTFVTASGPSVGSYITATATNSATTNTSEFSNAVVVAVPTVTDVSLSMSHTDPFVAGGQGTYNLTVFNGSAGQVTGPIQVTDTLPTGLTYASASGPGWSCGAAAQIVTCTNPASLPPAASLNLGITVNVAANATGTVTNTATLAAPPGDPAGNNTATNPTTIAPAPTPGTPTGALQFVAPVRVIDTRNGTGVQRDGRRAAAAQLPPGSVTKFRIAGETFGGTSVPTGTTGVLINVTISQQTAGGGFVTVFPGDVTTPPNASTVNPSRPIAANFWSVALPTTGPDAGTINVYSVGDQPRDVIIDLVGYYGPTARSAQAAGNVVFVTPTRVLDTRNGTGYQLSGQAVPAAPVTPNVVNQYALGGKTFGSVGFPADVSGVLAHVTVVQDQPSGGFTTLLPGDFVGTPSVSTVNPSTLVAFNAWAVGLPSSGPAKGAFGIYTTNANQHVVVDVVGYFSASAPVSPLTASLITPARVLDTRADNGGPIGFNEAGTPISAGQIPPGTTRRYKLAGQTFGSGLNQVTLPTDMKAGLMNVTIAQPAAGGGFVTVFPGDAAAPTASTVNPSTPVAASFWWSGVGTTAPFAGTIGVFSATDPRDVIIDVVGYYR